MMSAYFNSWRYSCQNSRRNIEDSSDLGQLLASLNKYLFDAALEIRKQLHACSSLSSTPSDSKGVRLPKLDVPTFNGHILSWKTFWEQFQASVHDRSNLTDSEKFTYLRHALQSGTAKSVIGGLSRSGEHYVKAISCLKSRYDKPRLIHQAHVQKILQIPNLMVVGRNFVASMTLP